MTDWYMHAKDAIGRVLSEHLTVEARRKDPLKPPFPAKGEPERLPAHEVAQREFFAATERLHLARALRDLARAVDWDAAVALEETEAEQYRQRARQLYDEHMATREVTR